MLRALLPLTLLACAPARGVILFAAPAAEEPATVEFHYLGDLVDDLPAGEWFCLAADPCAGRVFVFLGAPPPFVDAEMLVRLIRENIEPASWARGEHFVHLTVGH